MRGRVWGECMHTAEAAAGPAEVRSCSRKLRLISATLEHLKPDNKCTSWVCEDVLHCLSAEIIVVAETFVASQQWKSTWRDTGLSTMTNIPFSLGAFLWPFIIFINIYYGTTSSFSICVLLRALNSIAHILYFTVMNSKRPPTNIVRSHQHNCVCS